MGRSKGYDEDTVLTGAMELFRRKGYGAVSIKDLETETGLKAGSIYNSYGDKAGLFRAAFAHYNNHVLRDRLASYASKAAGLDGLRNLFLSLLHEPGEGSFGCLVTNSAIEFGGAGDLPNGVDEGLSLLLAIFSERLCVAKRTGMMVAGQDPLQTAAKLLALYQGILVLVRAGWDKAALENLVNDEFNYLQRKIV